MSEEETRKSFNTFLKMYFNSCKEVYDEMNFKELSGKQFKYLKEILKKEKISPSSFAKVFDLSKPTVTEIFNKFLDADLIIKESCANDKRKYFVKLTKRGEILARTNELESKRAVEKIYEKLSEEEIESLNKMFNKFEVKKL